MKKILQNKKLFINVLKILLVIFFITILSYKFFMSSFEKIEEENNKKNIQSLITIINDKLKNIEAITTDYAQWDDTYDFIYDNDEEFLFENFRENSDQIETLDIDFMIFADLKNKKVFSSFSNNIKQKTQIEDNILEKFKHRSEFLSIYCPSNITKDEELSFYLISKIPISNSTNSLAHNGFLYAGKKITSDKLSTMTKIFHKVSIKKERFNPTTLLDSDYLKNIKIDTTINEQDYTLVNTIELYDYKNNYVTSIITTSKRDLVKEGQETIFIYNTILTVFMFIIFFQFYRNKSFLEKYNKQLKKDVQTKTSQLKIVNKRLKQLSYTDELTKIKNRRAFFEKGELILKEAIAKKNELCVLMLDIDDFKQINDTYGHDIGDIVLKNLAKSIRKILDKKHIFARLGGEEFAIIFLDTKIDEAYKITEIIRKTIEEIRIKVENHELQYTLSLGLTSRNNLKEIDLILKEADKLLYNAKARGKNCIIRNR